MRAAAAGAEGLVDLESQSHRKFSQYQYRDSAIKIWLIATELLALQGLQFRNVMRAKYGVF